MQWYLELVRTRHLDVTPIITHHYGLDEWRDAFLACADQGVSGAVKVLFDRF
jgi:threonine dehydrogenase-like Zn-dependent dehydrogenase